MGTILERNLSEERKEFYIDVLVSYFQEQHKNDDSTAIPKMVEAYKKKISQNHPSEIREDFLYQSGIALDQYLDPAFIEYDSIDENGNIILISLSQSCILPYLYKDSLSLEEVAAIYTLIKPKVLNTKFIEGTKYGLFNMALVKEFYFLLEVLKKGVEKGDIKDKNNFLSYREFFIRNNLICNFIEQCLISEGFVKESITNKSQKEAKERILQQASQELNNNNASKIQRKLNNVLKLLYYMAEDKYSHEKGDEQSTAKRLETLSENKAQTIQKWLEDAAFLIQDDK